MCAWLIQFLPPLMFAALAPALLSGVPAAFGLAAVGLALAIACPQTLLRDEPSKRMDSQAIDHAINDLSLATAGDAEDPMQLLLEQLKDEAAPLGP